MKSGVLLTVAGIIAILLAGYLLFSYNVSFREYLITIYIKIAPEKTSYQSNVVSCTDDETLVDYFTKGTVTLMYKNGISDIYADSCVNSLLKEYSCEFNNIKEQDYECEAGCFEGACVNPSEESGVIDSNLSQFCKSYRVTSPLNAIAQNEYGAYSALNAIDGNIATHWFGDPAHPYPKWIYFDMADKVCISDVDLYAFKEDLPIQGSIQASQDAIRWTTIVSNITLVNSSMTINLPDIVTARYVRWFETSSNRSYGSLTDIRLRVADLPENVKNA